jgi:hypothetical protein
LADLTELKVSAMMIPGTASHSVDESIEFLGLKNLIVYGVGLISSLLSILGIAIIIKRIFSLFKKVNVQKYY